MRSIWSGAISFGLVNIPVNLYSAAKNRRPNFRMLRKRDLCPIKYVRVCERNKEEVPFSEIAKGVEFQEGFYVVLDENDFKRADPEKSRIIKITHFSEGKEISPELYEKPYYLEAGDSSGKAFALFSKALEKTKKIAFGQFVLRNRESLAAIRPFGKLLILNEIRFPEEIADPSQFKGQKEESYSKEELKMAEDLIKQMSGDFDIKQYKDTYAEKLKKVIEEKAEGKIPAEKIEDQPAAETFDLMAKLKESLEKTKHGRS